MNDTNDTYIQMIPIRTTSDKINTVPVVDGQLIQLSDKGKLYYDAGTTRCEVSGGHTIQDKSGTDLADQNTLQFAGYQAVTNDSTNGKTIVDNTPITITWAEYQALTSEQRQGNHYLLTNIPSGGGTGGGHVIEDDAGTDMPQEENLQFVGVYTEDDATNDRTKVNIVREMTSAQMQSLTTAQKKGFIRTTDEPNAPYSAISNAEINFTEASERTNIASGESISTLFGKIKKFFTDLKAVAFSGSASDVDYSNSQSGLSATKVQGAIDELKSGVTSVEQILDSIKTKQIVGFDNLSDVTPTINNCYHNGIIAELNITFLSTSAKTGWNKIAKVSPAPSVDRNIPLFNGSTNEAIGYCLIEASGDVKILNMPNNTYLTIVGSYFLI